MKNSVHTTWVEVSKEALAANIRQFKKLVGPDVILCPCVKANAYGHGLVETSKVFIEAGADWLGVNAIYEARFLREAGVAAPIYVLGYVPLGDLEEAVDLDLRMVVYNKETVDKLGKISNEKNKKVRIHLKAETGNNRQGLLLEEIVPFAQYISKFPNIEIEGLATHFANIEDTTDHSYAKKQIEKFLKFDEELRAAGIKVNVKHCANSAATILFPETHFDMVRVGIACYGMWPSSETHVSYMQSATATDFALTPAFTWKSHIAQIKNVPEGEYIGYGCMYKTTRASKIAIIPVGYYDGYDRGLSGKAHVLICGKRAPLRGRVCMNIIMADVTDIADTKLEDEVILIGKDGDEDISVEQFAKWADTINYEATTRVNERIPRIFV
jgi:alanine racemase